MTTENTSSAETTPKPVESERGVCLFLGIPLSMRSLKAVAQAAAEISQETNNCEWDVRWVPPARYHVTIAYLGWAKPEIIPAVIDVVSAALRHTSPFDMRCREVGAFEVGGKPRVLWAGIDDRRGDLAAMHKKVQEAVHTLGFSGTDRPFVPHVTIARTKSMDSECAKKLNDFQSISGRMFSKTWVERLILYKTQVESNSSEYTNLASIAFD